MALSKVKFNDTEIPFLSSWEESYNSVEISGQTESGADTIVLIRPEKLEVNARGTLLSDDVAAIEAFRAVHSFTLTLSDGSAHTVRMRDFKKARKAKSETLNVTDGVWSVSFTLIEF